MATTITLKNIPAELYAAIKARAENSRRSINSEVLFSLETHYGVRREDAKGTLDRIRARGPAYSGPPLTDEMINEAKGHRH